MTTRRPEPASPVAAGWGRRPSRRPPRNPGRLGPALALVAWAAAALLLGGCAARKAALAVEEQRTWDTFIQKQLAEGMTQPSSPEAGAVAKLGDKIIPYVEQNFGKAWRDPAGKGDYWLIIVLARLGTPRAVKGICTVLEHKYPGAIGRDRETAAKALVWLGAKDAVPVLKAALADHEMRLAEKVKEDPQKAGRYDEELKALRESLNHLEAGWGKRDTANFPFEQ